MGNAYLVVLGEREAIVWVLRQRRMAFPGTPRAEVAALAPGDRLFLYATRGAWHNPTRDRGRVIGTATVLTPVKRLNQPVQIAGRSFPSGCQLRLDGVVPYPGGLELQPLVGQLEAFPRPHAWSVYLRRALLRLSPADSATLERGVRPLLVEPGEAVPTYVAALRAATTSR